MTLNTTKKAAGAINTNDLHTESNNANSLTDGAIDQALAESITKRAVIASIVRGAAAKTMSDAVVSTRSVQGKDIKQIHFMNEHLLCNWILTGHHGSIDDDSHDDSLMCRLDEIRTTNAALIVIGLTRVARKEALREAFPLPQQGDDLVNV
jgi:hypothetical protein